MEVEKYIITYKIGNDIPINPEWIRDQIRAAVDKLQAEIDKRIYMANMYLNLNATRGCNQLQCYKLQASSCKHQALDKGSQMM